MREAWGVAPDSFVVGFLGRLSPEKNPAVMVELAKSLDDPRCHVVVVGGGGLLGYLREASKDLPNFHMVGSDQRVGDVLRAFDTLVVPSKFESYGLSIVEGCSMGVPVVSTAVGIASVVPGLTRVVEEPTGMKLWAAIEEDRWDVEGTASRVSSAKQWVAENASIEMFGKRWSDHLARLVQPSPPGLLRMTTNFTKAVVGHVGDGLRKASPEVQAQRKAICEGCPLLDKINDRCTSCGCLAMDLKRSWASSACPEGKWMAV